MALIRPSGFPGPARRCRPRCGDGGGAAHADFRFERLLTSSLTIRDTAVRSVTDTVTTGFAVRVIVDGVWGFAASVVPTAEEAVATARRAVRVARALSGVVDQRVERADEPVWRDQEWGQRPIHGIDPFAVAGPDKIGLLLDRSERLLASDGVAHTQVGLLQVKENSSTATPPARAPQQQVRMEPTLTATAVDGSTGAFETMSSLTPPVGRGFEYLTDGTWDFDGEIAAMGGQLMEKMKAPSSRAATTWSSTRRTYG